MISQTCQKLFLSATSATLVVLGLTTLSADAITFNINGNRIKGSYTLSDDLYSKWLSSVNNPPYDSNGYYRGELFGRNGDIPDFKLFLDGAEVDYKTGLTATEFFTLGNYNTNTPNANYNYFDLTIRKQYSQGSLPAIFSVYYDAIGSKDQVLDCITSGKSCTVEASFYDTVLGANFSEKVTHSVVTGSSKLVPISAQQVGDSLLFNNAQSGFWFATPSSLSGSSFELEMAGDAKLNQINSFLAGLTDGTLFTLSVGDSVLGQYKSGDNIDFVQLLGSGVSKLKVTSSKTLTANELNALSSQFIFDKNTANFKMTPSSSTQPTPQPKPVPEPTSALALLTLAGAWMFKRQSSSAKVQLVSKGDSLA